MAGNMNKLMCVSSIPGSNAVNNDYVVTRGYEVVDVISTQNATAGGAATVQPQRGVAGVFANLAAALTVTTTDLVVYGTTVVDAEATFVTGQTLRVVGDRADTNATVDFYVIPTSWIAG